MRHYYEPGGTDETNDPATWDRASFQSHPVDILELIDLEPNGYRQAALRHLELMYRVDQFLSDAKDARFAVIVVGIVFNWPSTRGLTVADIASQIDCSPLTITRACDHFREMAGLDSNGGVRLSEAPPFSSHPKRRFYVRRDFPYFDMDREGGEDEFDRMISGFSSPIPKTQCSRVRYDTPGPCRTGTTGPAICLPM